MDSGAHFFKVDFQVHTPRDPQWKGTRPVDDEGRKQYAERFVAACRDRGLQAVAITDHHDFTFVKYIREAAQNEEKPGGGTYGPPDQLVVYPGLELTLAVPCQAILILSADFPSEKLSTLLALLNITPAPDEAASARDPEQLRFDLNKLHEHLDTYEWLKGQYIVFPNVTDGGKHTLLRRNMRRPYIEMPCVGGYIDGGKKIGDGNRRIFAGQDKNWGNRKIAVIRTSDARDDDFKLLGRFPTWIKWSEPTAEALRQACLASESRITLESPTLPEVVISSLSVSDSQFMGPINVEFNPQYNAFIGGRGTGKSTCLEYLRWALCDHQEVDEDETGSPDLRRARLIDQTLKPAGGQVEVGFLLNGTPHLVRKYSDSGDVMLKIGDGDLTPATADDVRALLPVVAYSQKQLSNVGVRESELARFVTSPIRSSLDALASDSEKLSTAIRENFARVRRSVALKSDITRVELQKSSIAQRVGSVRGELHGLSEDDKAILVQKEKFDRTGHIKEAWINRLEQAQKLAESTLSNIRTVKNGLRPRPDDSEVAVHDQLSELEHEVAKVLQEMEENARAMVATAEGALGPGSETRIAAGNIDKSIEEYNIRYDAARSRSAAEQSKVDELRKLESEQGKIAASLEHLIEEAEKYADAESKHEDLLKKWREEQRRATNLIRAQCEQLTSLSDGRIRATLSIGVGVKDFAADFKKAISGSNVKGSKVEAFIDSISKSKDPLLAWHQALESLQEILVARETDDRWKLPGNDLSQFSKTELERIASVVTPDEVLSLALIVPKNVPKFEYRTKEDEYIAFEDASAGQQATALLHVLLAQDGPPLIIDQPEDDLDSQVVLEIVEKIWDAKSRRQLIFSSHNANLVVNGDAELVVCCDYTTQGDHSEGRIKAMGAIDVSAVKNEITSVMEGGERAFKLRKEKYGF